MNWISECPKHSVWQDLFDSSQTHSAYQLALLTKLVARSPFCQMHRSLALCLPRA